MSVFDRHFPYAISVLYIGGMMVLNTIYVCNHLLLVLGISVLFYLATCWIQHGLKRPDSIVHNEVAITIACFLFALGAWRTGVVLDPVHSEQLGIVPPLMVAITWNILLPWNVWWKTHLQRESAPQADQALVGAP